MIAKARSAIGTCAYVLGAGGWDPASAEPGSRLSAELQKKHGRERGCDCSGFVAWLCGKSRKQTIVAGMWGISTDSIYCDATTAQAVFERIAAPEPGCFAVYPDVGKSQGHVALVIDPAARTVIDCAYSRKGISEHEAGYFWRKPQTVWCRLKVAS